MIRFLVRLFALLVLAYALGYAAFVVLLPRAAEAQRTDAIVVLTGGPGRLQRGFDLLAEGRAERMLISGVQRTVRPEELEATHDVEDGLFDCCIDLGREAVDTRSNADEVARWLKKRGYRSMRLITTDWHMPRARFEIARRVEPGVAILSDAVPSSPSFRQLFTEYNKFLLRHAAELIGI
ncbi:MAG: YdcF family protein [Allosphingosinicella sp.]|uniref:YdcF family protein n=1 Tax=Allosphingosinicella sp. TaxID=2823234 RepID=UPI0039555125